MELELDTLKTLCEKDDRANALLLKKLSKGGNGKWEWFRRGRYLHHRVYQYYLEFDRCTTSAECLDWIFQIRNKTWCDKDTLFDLLEAIQFIIHPQELLCSGGIERNHGKTITYKAHAHYGKSGQKTPLKQDAPNV
jgi:hypothetical protein